METFENKIKKIRSTIDDIRNDIESMKHKNDKTLTNMIQSITNIKKDDIRELNNRSDITLGNKNNLSNNSYLSDLSIKINPYEEKPTKDRFNKHTITNYEYKQSKISNNSFDSKIYEDSGRKKARNRLPKMNDSFSIHKNTSYLSDFTEGPNFNINEYDTGKYSYKENLHENIRPHTERITRHEELKTETSHYTIGLEKQISELHTVINDLHKKNSLLQMEISKNKQNSKIENPIIDTKSRNISRPVRSMSENRNLNYDYNNEYKSNTINVIEKNANKEKIDENKKIVNELKKLMGNIESGQIITKFESYLNKIKENKIRDEFITKLSSIQKRINPNIKQENDVKSLWRWVKDIIRETKFKPNKSEEIEIYKEICENIIKDYVLKDAHDLRKFINELLEKNMKNKRRVDRIKKLIMTEPQNNISKYSNDSY